MATSGATTGLDTVRDIVTDALRELQVYGANRQPSNADAAFALRRLNWMLKGWQNDGVNLWRQEDIDLDWTGGMAEGDVSPAINDILSLRFVSDTTERQLTRWEIAQYGTLPNKATVGNPSIYCCTAGLNGLRLRIWPVPADDFTFRASINRRIEDVTDLSETLDVPQQYTETVMMNLAAALAAPFGKANDPNAVVTIRKAAQLYGQMRAADRPASYFLGPVRGYR